MTTPIRSMADFHAKRRANYLQRSMLPPGLQDADFETLAMPVEVKVKCAAFIKQFTDGTDLGKGLMFTGKPGRGKTTIAAATLLECMNQAPHDRLGKTDQSYPMLPGYFVTYPELIYQHRTSWGKNEEAQEAEDLLRSLYGRQSRDHWNTRVLVLDDIGKEHSGASGFTSATLHDLLRSRYYKGLPTLVTTNLDQDDIEQAYGDAMASFIHEAFAIVEVGGKDRRRS